MKRPRAALRRCVFFLAVLLLAATGRSEVVRIEIESRQPLAGGHSFGDVGPYEKLTGRLYFEVDPKNAANSRIRDLELAPRNERGKVEFSAGFFLLQPADPQKGNRQLFYCVNNRGNKLATVAFLDRTGNNPTTLEETGNGFFMRQGYSVLWSGWNGDVTEGGDRLTADLPIATKDGKPIEGRIYTEIVVNRKTFSRPLFGVVSDPYPTIDLNDPKAVLTMRPSREEPAVEVPRDDWAFAQFKGGKSIPDAKHLYVKEGFRPGWLYELVYTSKNPRVTGLGLAAVRDAVSFFRYGGKETQNPLAGAIQRAYGFGNSQPGRFLHHFVWEDFNGDELGRMVFDGVMPTVSGAGKGLFNCRFGQTTRYGAHLEDALFPCDYFPFTSVPQTDPVTGQRGEMLTRARKSGHVPKVFFIQTSAEYWTRAASLLHTDVEGKRDMAVAPNVRIYMVAGGDHRLAGEPRPYFIHYPPNRLDHRLVLRALLVALDHWATTGEEPPPNRFPKIADGTLVDLAAYRKSFPHIPGVEPPESFYAPLRLDPGPRWDIKGIASFVPPRTGAPFRTLVPAVDADGNERSGIRLPDVAVPLGTYTGWNLRGAEVGATNMLARLVGSHWPFARTADERGKTHDPRRSILERYPTRQDYLDRVTRVTRQLQREGFLLDEDAEAIVQKAESQTFWNDPMSGVVDAAGEYLAAACDKRAQLEQTLREYKGPVEPVIDRLIAALPKRWEKTTGSLDDQHFTAPGLCEKYKDDLLYFYVPEDYRPSRPFGLLILMHGGGNGSPRTSARVAVASPEQMSSAYGFRPHVDNIPFISVAPSAPWNEKNSARWNLPEADDYIAAVIRECGYRFNIDRDRVFLGGVSMGGFGAFHLCQRLADRIAGGIPCAGSWQCSNWRCMVGTPLFIIHGSADAVAPGTPGEKARPRFTDVFFARAADKLLAEAGAEHVYSEYKGGHWPRGEEKSVPQMVEWLEGKRRDPFSPRVVALTPRGWNADSDKETPHHRWVSILEMGDGRIDFDRVKRTGPGPQWKEPLEDFNKQGFELAKRPIRAGLVDARYQGDNRFEVTTENVKKFSLWLHPKMVDFAKPITLIVNGKMQTHRAQPTLLDALRSYHRRADWGLIYHCELPVVVQ